MHRNIQLTTGFMAALFMAAVIAPGAPLHPVPRFMGKSRRGLSRLPP